MSPVEQATVRRKLALLVAALEKLKGVEHVAVAEWASDADLHDATERRLQVCIESAVDIAAHVLVGMGHPAPADARQAFLDLATKAGVIPQPLAHSLAPAAGLRNRLVHQYDDLDDRLILEGVREALRSLPVFVEHVETWLRSRG